MSTKEQTTHVPKGKTAAEALVTGGAIAIALILLNVLTCSSRARVDLTEAHIYSLSDASRSLVSNLKEKVNIKFYAGNVPTEHDEKRNYVDMLLSEYADRSGGKIVYEKIDPWGNKELQDELKKDGVDMLRLQSLKDDSYEQVPMYFHVVFSHLDKKEVWTPAQGFALEGLEYDFSTRIKRLGYGKKKVGLTTGFGEPPSTKVVSGEVQIPGGFKLDLADLYDVSTVDWSKDPKSIAGVDILVVNGPSEKVSDAAKAQLDQLIMQGKPVLFLASGMRWQAGNGQQQIPGFENPDEPYIGMPGEGGVADLLETYGFKVGQDAILDGRNSGMVVIPPGSRQGRPVRGLAPFALARKDDPILGGLDVVALPFASTLSLVGPLEPGKVSPETQVIRLLETAPTSWKKGEVIALTNDTRLVAPDKEHGPYLVAAAVSGKFKSFYADKALPTGVDVAPPAPSEQPSDGEADGPAAPAAPAPGPAPAAGPLKESVSHTRMVVVSAPQMAADTTLIDMVYVNNVYAFHNLVDWLAEDTNLIAVRSKKPERPIDRLEAGQRSAIKYGNVVGAPLLLVVFGIIYWRLRERKRRNIVL